MDVITLSHRLDQLSDALHRSFEVEGGCCTLLLSQGRDGPQPDNLLDTALQGAMSVAVPVPDSRLQGSPMPLLVRLDTASAGGSHLLQLSLREALEECLLAATPETQGRRICGWIRTAQGLPALGRAISRHLLQRLPDGREALVRWTDPGVLWALWRVLRPDQRTALLGPVGAIWLLDPGGHLECIEPEAPATEPGSRLRLDARQWSELETIGPMNRALSRWIAGGGNIPIAEDGRAVALRALRTARGLGFTDSKDLETFAFYALTVHPNFAAHPWVQERLGRRTADDYFSAVIDDLTEAHWRRIGADLALMSGGQMAQDQKERQG